MRIFLLALFAASQTVDYSPLIFGMLEGAKLADKVSISRCKHQATRSRSSISFAVLLQDAISLSTSCKWKSSVKVLSNFKQSKTQVAKASEEFSSFILAVLDRPANKMKQDGYAMGQILEYRIANLSPFVTKFKFIGEEVMNHTEKSPPIAVFHGLSDCCAFPGIAEFTRFLAKEGNTVAKCVEIGDGAMASWLMGFPLQVQTACESLKKDKAFGQGVNLVGLSQGGLLVRALAETCEIDIKNVISIGGPQMGLAKTPKCETGYYCDIYQDAVDMGVYTVVPQVHIGPPGYYKDPLLYETYVEKSGYLALVNNERVLNSTLIKNLAKIKSLVLVMFENDSVTDPKISQHFGYYKNGSKNIVLSYNKTNDYVNDLIGLRTLDGQKKVVFESIPGDHLEMTSADVQRVVIPYLF